MTGNATDWILGVAALFVGVCVFSTSVGKWMNPRRSTVCMVEFRSLNKTTTG
jgi:hypothetical protein